jgi:hypothetical protein
MAVRDTLVARAAPFLRDGEVVQEAFRARVRFPTANLAKATYVVVGTPTSVLILRTSTWSTKAPRTLVARIPRSAPMALRKEGLWWEVQVGDHRLQFGGRATVAEARRLVEAAGSPPA